MDSTYLKPYAGIVTALLDRFSDGGNNDSAPAASVAPYNQSVQDIVSAPGITATAEARGVSWRYS